MTDPVKKHLKDIDNGVLLVLKHVIHLHFGAEGHPVTILIGSLFTGDMTTSNGCFCRSEITEKNILEGGWKACHISGDYWGGKM